VIEPKCTKKNINKTKQKVDNATNKKPNNKWRLHQMKPQFNGTKLDEPIQAK
jgi:hypothetical protein